MHDPHPSTTGETLGVDGLECPCLFSFTERGGPPVPPSTALGGTGGAPPTPSTLMRNQRSSAPACRDAAPTPAGGGPGMDPPLGGARYGTPGGSRYGPPLGGPWGLPSPAYSAPSGRPQGPPVALLRRALKAGHRHRLVVPGFLRFRPFFMLFSIKIAPQR